MADYCKNTLHNTNTNTKLNLARSFAFSSIYRKLDRYFPLKELKGFFSSHIFLNWFKNTNTRIGLFEQKYLCNILYLKLSKVPKIHVSISVVIHFWLFKIAVNLRLLLYFYFCFEYDFPKLISKILVIIWYYLKFLYLCFRPSVYWN